MLTIVDLDSWLDFEKIMKERLLFETENMPSGPMFYRGHPDANWHLETTLERSAGKNITVRTYYQMIEKIHSKIETFTDQRWDLPSYEDFYETLKQCPSSINNPAYIYMTYLRHFGFPSPLLDWTMSPFIAAYFAFRDVSSTAKSIAIYQFLATSDLFIVSVGDYGGVQIFPIVTFPRNNKRHELQQGVYTICLKGVNDQIYYVSHEDPRMLEEDRDPYITKYILPASERSIALHSLRAYNINSYSLFGTEESLLESFFLRKYVGAALTKKICGLDDINDLW